MFTKEIVGGVSVLTNKRLTKDWEHLQKIRDARAEVGKKGGLAKASNCLTGSSKEVSKQVSKEKEREEKEDTSPSDFPSEDDGQGDIMRADKQIDSVCQNVFGKRANLRGRNLEQIKDLERLHKGSSVVRAFEEWALANADDPDVKDPVYSFLFEANEILSGDSPAARVTQDPEVIRLSRALMKASGDELLFVDKHKVRLSSALEEGFTVEQIVSAFGEWFPKQNLEKDKSFLPGTFAQTAGDLTSRYLDDKKVRAADQVARDASIVRLQKEAEENRLEFARQKQAEAELFDPLAELLE
jgi:hypothetical protein